MFVILVLFYNEYSGVENMKRFVGKDRAEAQKRWKEFEDKNPHQRFIRSEYLG